MVSNFAYDVSYPCDRNTSVLEAFAGNRSKEFRGRHMTSSTGVTALKISMKFDTPVVDASRMRTWVTCRKTDSAGLRFHVRKLCGDVGSELISYNFCEIVYHSSMDKVSKESTWRSLICCGLLGQSQACLTSIQTFIHRATLVREACTEFGCGGQAITLR